MGTFSDWKARATALAARAGKLREAAEKATETVIRTTEVAGTAFGLAYLRGRYPSVIEGKTQNDLLVAGVPVSLMLGIGGHVAGFAGVFGKYDEHIHNIATGALAEYAATKAAEIGKEHKKEAEKPAKPKVSGEFGPGNAYGPYNQQNWGYEQNRAQYAYPAMGRGL